MVCEIVTTFMAFLSFGVNHPFEKGYHVLPVIDPSAYTAKTPTSLTVRRVESAARRSVSPAACCAAHPLPRHRALVRLYPAAGGGAARIDSLRRSGCVSR